MKHLKNITKHSLDTAQDIGLIIIAVATIIAIGMEVMMIGHRAVTLWSGWRGVATLIQPLWIFHICLVDFLTENFLII